MRRFAWAPSKRRRCRFCSAWIPPFRRKFDGSRAVRLFRLTAGARRPYAAAASRPDGRRASGGKSGLHTDAAPDNVRRGRPQGKRHRKQTAPIGRKAFGARVKGCGKSAPRRRQRSAARQAPPGAKPNRSDARVKNPQAFPWASRSGWLLEAPGDGRPRGMAVTSGETPAIQNPAYRPAGVCFSRPPCWRGFGNADLILSLPKDEPVEG